MLKIIIGLFIGLGLGAAAGYYYSENIYKNMLSLVEAEKDSKLKELSSCQEQKISVEKQFQDAEAELKLNEERSCFVTSATLKAPEITPPGIEPIQSNSSGDIILNWTPMKGAKKYIVKVETESGEVVNTTDVEGEPTLYLNRISNASKLAAAKYFVSVTAINGLDQEGAPSERRPIEFATLIQKSEPKESKTAAKLKAKVEAKLKSKSDPKAKSKTKETSNLKKKSTNKKH